MLECALLAGLHIARQDETKQAWHARCVIADCDRCSPMNLSATLSVYCSRVQVSPAAVSLLAVAAGASAASKIEILYISALFDIFII